MIVAPGRARPVRPVRVPLAILAETPVPADQQRAARGHARADDRDVHLDARPQPRHVPVPADVVGLEEDDDDVVEADGGGGDDEEAGGEEGEDLQLLGGADLEEDQGAQRDDEDDDVEEEVRSCRAHHVSSFVDAVALGVGQQDFPVVAEGSGRMLEGTGTETLGGGRRTGIAGR